MKYMKNWLDQNQSDEIPYLKEIYDKNGVLIKVGDRLKGTWKTHRGSGKFYEVIDGVAQSTKKYPIPAIKIIDNKGESDYLLPEYDYENWRFVLKGRSNDMTLEVEVINDKHT